MNHTTVCVHTAIFSESTKLFGGKMISNLTYRLPLSDGRLWTGIPSFCTQRIASAQIQQTACYK